MIPKFPKFKILELSDKDEILNLTKQLPPYSDYNFIQMWIWDINEPATISILNDNLITKQSDSISGIQYYSVIGTNSIAETITQVLTYLNTNNIAPILKWIPEETINCLDEFSELIAEDRDSFDYILDVSKINQANGREYKNFRNVINRFNNYYPNADIHLIDLSDNTVRDQILKLFKIFSTQAYASDSNEYMLNALSKLITFADEFTSLKALGLYYNGNLIAFIALDIINQDYALASFLISDKSYPGAFQFLLKSTINMLHQQGIKYLNLEADYGIESWRDYKSSYRPSHFLKKYTIESRIESSN